MTDATMPREGTQEPPGATEAPNWHPDATRVIPPVSAARQPACPICHHARSDWHVCLDCRTRVDQQLGDLLDLHAIAQNPAALHPRSGTGIIAGNGKEPPVPINIDALDVAIGADILGTLEQWERWWREHWNLTAYGAATEQLPRPHRPGDATLTHVVGFLRTWWPRAADVIEPPPDEFADEVRRLHGRALAALALTRFDLDPDSNAEEPADWTITCPHIRDDGTTCGHRIGMRRQPLPIDGRAPDPVAVTCPRCRTHWRGPWLIRVAIDCGTDVAMSIDQAMDVYACSERTIRRKVKDGVLIHQRGRYRPADTQTVADR